MAGGTGRIQVIIDTWVFGVTQGQCLMWVWNGPSRAPRSPCIEGLGWFAWETEERPERWEEKVLRWILRKACAPFLKPFSINVTSHPALCHWHFFPCPALFICSVKLLLPWWAVPQVHEITWWGFNCFLKPEAPSQRLRRWEITNRRTMLCISQVSCQRLLKMGRVPPFCCGSHLSSPHSLPLSPPRGSLCILFLSIQDTQRFPKAVLLVPFWFDEELEPTGPYQVFAFLGKISKMIIRYYKWY